MTITVIDGTVIVGATTYPTLDYFAENNEDVVTIHHKDLDSDIICQGKYDTLNLTGLGVPASAVAFVVAFNALVATTVVADATGVGDVVDRLNELLAILRSKEIIT